MLLLRYYSIIINERSSNDEHNQHSRKLNVNQTSNPVQGDGHMTYTCDIRLVNLGGPENHLSISRTAHALKHLQCSAL